MTLKTAKSRMDLTGDVTVDEAETIFAWLSANPKATVNCSAANHMHTAVFQALAASKCKVSKVPDDSFSAECMRQLML